MNTEEFIEKARKVHGDKFDYSKVEYVNSKTPVCIICPIHGEFWQRHYDHLNGCGCSKCGKIETAKKNKSTAEEFIEKARKVHGDKYDYSKVEYINNHTKVCIICPEHGEFWQTPASHLSGIGCKRCAFEQIAKKNKSTTEEFIEKARKVHGDKFDYSKVEYIDAKTKVCIICPIHGKFWQTPQSHLQGCGCPKCANEKNKDALRDSAEEFIEKARKVHGDKYDYSKVEYINNRTKVCIICPEHGEFWQVPWSHLNGNACPKCAYEIISKKKQTVDTDEWIRRAKSVHSDRYDYSKSIYKGYYEKIEIICPIHGSFWQLSYDHLQGKGCPKCSRSKLEIDFEVFLINNNFNFITQYRPEFLKYKKRYFSLDFYLPDYNIGIECQGAQHFENCLFYGNKNLDKIQERDKLKAELCHKNNVKLIYYTNLDIKDYFGELYTDKEKLLNAIKIYGEKRLL